MSGVQSCLDRWQGKIDEVTQGYDKVLAEAVQASSAMVSTVDTDLVPLTQAWGAIESRLRHSTDEISNAWDEISDELSDLDDVEDEVMNSAGRQLDTAICELEIHYTRAYTSTMAKAAQNMLFRALAEDAKEHSCTQCGAQLDRISPVSISRNVACDYCASVNSIHPGPRLRNFAATGAHLLAEAAALESWEAMKRAESEIDGYRDRKDVPLTLLETFESSSRQYYTTRFKTEAHYVPEETQYVEKRLESSMKHIEKKLRQHWQWRNRGH